MNRPCKELKRIARLNLSGRYGTPMSALLLAGIIPLMTELPFSMLQQSSQPLSQTIIFYIADFLISLLSIVLSVGLLRLHLSLSRGEQYQTGMVFWAFKNHPDRCIVIGLLMFIIELVALLPMIASLILLNVSHGINLGKIAIVIFASLISVVMVTLVQLWYALAFFLLLDHGL